MYQMEHIFKLLALRSSLKSVHSFIVLFKQTKNEKRSTLTSKGRSTQPTYWIGFKQTKYGNICDASVKIFKGSIVPFRLSGSDLYVQLRTMHAYQLTVNGCDPRALDKTRLDTKKCNFVIMNLKFLSKHRKKKNIRGHYQKRKFNLAKNGEHEYSERTFINTLFFLTEMFILFVMHIQIYIHLCLHFIGQKLNQVTQTQFPNIQTKIQDYDKPRY